MKIIKIKDYYGEYQCVPVDDDFFEEWCNMRRESYNHKRQEKKHAIYLTAETIDALSVDNEDPIFAEYARSDELLRLYEAIKKLPPIQRQRIYMLLNDMSYTDIARAEGRDLSAICKSIKRAVLALKRFMGE